MHGGASAGAARLAGLGCSTAANAAGVLPTAARGGESERFGAAASWRRAGGELAASWRRRRRERRARRQTLRACRYVPGLAGRGHLGGPDAGWRGRGDVPGYFPAALLPSAGRLSAAASTIRAGMLRPGAPLCGCAPFESGRQGGAPCPRAESSALSLVGRCGLVRADEPAASFLSSLSLSLSFSLSLSRTLS